MRSTRLRGARVGMVRMFHGRACSATFFRLLRALPLTLVMGWCGRITFCLLLQGRFPIRVELQSLTMEDFVRILTEPKSSLVKQYTALLETEGVKLEFTPEALSEIAHFAFRVNESTENIGARRLHTIMERVLDELSFDAPERKGDHVVIDADYVRKMLTDIVKDQDLSRYIL